MDQQRSVSAAAIASAMLIVIATIAVIVAGVVFGSPDVPSSNVARAAAAQLVLPTPCAGSRRTCSGRAPSAAHTATHHHNQNGTGPAATPTPQPTPSASPAATVSPAPG